MDVACKQPQTWNRKTFLLSPHFCGFSLSGERPYRCSFVGCDKAFAQLSNLQQHQRNHENKLAAEEQRPFFCRICDRRFTTDNGLTKHIAKVSLAIDWNRTSSNTGLITHINTCCCSDKDKGSYLIRYYGSCFTKTWMSFTLLFADILYLMRNKQRHQVESQTKYGTSGGSVHRSSTASYSYIASTFSVFHLLFF